MRSQLLSGLLVCQAVAALALLTESAWVRPSGEEVEPRGLGFKRYPMYDFGLGKRGEEDEDYEDVDKRGGSGMYSFGLGKRNRAYSFGLGKRLEAGWKNQAINPAYSRQERRSKVYSFGLGKRSDEEAWDEKRASPSRQFSFGLGKRDFV